MIGFDSSALNLELLHAGKLARKSTLLVTHSVPEAVLLSDRAIVMGIRPGRILEAVGVPFDRPRDPFMITSPEFVDVVH